MTMSKDRVRFTLTGSMLCKCRMEGVLNKAFNINVKTAESYLNYDKDHDSKTVVIICRPSQFARFLIYRNEADIDNSFKAIKPELFTPDQEKKSPLDVSTHKGFRDYGN